MARVDVGGLRRCWRACVAVQREEDVEEVRLDDEGGTRRLREDEEVGEEEGWSSHVWRVEAGMSRRR